MALSAADAARVRPVKVDVEDDLLALPGVTGVDIDEVVADDVTVAGIVVYADPAAVAKVRAAVPPTIRGIPTEVRGMRIELQEIELPGGES